MRSGNGATALARESTPSGLQNEVELLEKELARLEARHHQLESKNEAAVNELDQLRSDMASLRNRLVDIRKTKSGDLPKKTSDISGSYTAVSRPMEPTVIDPDLADTKDL